MGESSWPGRSLQARTAPPIPGERAVSIDVARQAGCLVATAAFGSELATPVQLLRNFRDDDVQRTFLGARFLEAFNAWYYSWSPTVAGVEAQSGPLRAYARVFLTPLIGVLIVSRPIFHTLAGFNPEPAILTTGMIASALIGIIYLTPLFLLASRVSSVFMFRKSLPCLAFAGIVLALLGTLPYGSISPAEVFLAIIVVQIVLASPALITRMLLYQENRRNSN